MAGVNHLLKKPQQSTRLGSVKSVCKRDGFIEPFSIEKLEGWAEWACARHANTDWNLVIRNALRYVAKEQIHTDELQELLIKSAIALVNTQPEYDLVARDLYLARLRKQVYDSFDPPSLRGWHDILVRLGTWQDMSIYLTEEDWERLENAIDHERDFRFSYAGIKQFADKYLRRNDMTDELYETPQFTYMGMAMSMLEAEDWTVDEVIELYDAMSLHKLNIPTPLLVGLRSTDRGFASCCLMEAGDSLDSIDAAEHIIFKMVAARAGIGYLPRTRSVGDPIRGGAFMSTGKLPYIRHALSSTQANTQQCYSDDTEVLTKGGWKLFKDVSVDELVAQVTDSRAIEWVYPIDLFEYTLPEGSSLTRLHKRGIDLLVTDNHTMVYRQVSYDDKSVQRSKGYQEVMAGVWNPKRTHALDFGGVNTCGQNDISAEDRFRIALQADGSITESGAYRFGFSKERKVNRLLSILEELGYNYSTSVNSAGVTAIYVSDKHHEFTKDLSFLVDRGLSSLGAEIALREIMEWDGYWKSEYVGEYTSYIDSNVDVVQTLSSIAGFRSNTSTPHRCYVYFSQTDMTGEGIKKTKVPYVGKVYCVEVPTNKLVVRRKGMPLVCGNSRGGSMTANIPYFDPEIMDIISAKSQRSAAEKRLDKSDFAIQINRMLLKRALKGESITLMSLYYAPELYNEFVNPNGTPESFEKVYSEAEARLKGKKRQGKGGKLVPLCQTLPAIDILEHIVTVRMETGRLYIQLMDNTNSHSNFDEPIKMSNLCVEINQPTYAFDHVVDLYKTPAELHNAEPGDIGEVSLCNLGAFTLGNFDDSEWERLAYLLLKMIDTVIEIQDYAFPTMEFTAKARRNVGIGLMNVAGAMAKDGLQFVGVEARNWIHRKMENHAYWLHKASVRLAKERGAATWAKHALPMKHGRLVIDTYNKSVDELVTEPLHLDWEGLRAEIAKHGMRNSVLSAQMPGESSSVVQGVTNSINPIREIVTYKRSGVNIVPQVAYGVTDGQGLEDIYTFAFDLDMEEWIKFVAVIQKFMNQSISADLWYRYTDYENERIPNSVVIRHIMLAMKYGWKSMYYAWFDVDNGGSVHTQAQGCDSGACSI